MRTHIDFLPQIELINSTNEAACLFDSIGVDKTGIDIMKDKALFFCIKIKSLTIPQASVIKQEMLSLGGDAANARGTITSSIKATDVLLMGTKKQYGKLSKKLKLHPFGLPTLSDAITNAISNFSGNPKPLKIKGFNLNFKKRAYIMGIVNMTPDSFSDGGQFSTHEQAVNFAKSLIKSGADIIDIGGESSRPGASDIPKDEEIERVFPLVRALASGKCLISVDTRRSEVANACLKAGAHIINDISALNHDKKMAKVISRHKAGVVLMHMQGTPKDMQNNPCYSDLIYDIILYLKNSIAIALKNGILFDHIIIDPGFGFGKRLEDNYRILDKLSGFRALGLPILAGMSRKSMIGSVLGIPEKERDLGTAVASALAIYNGANIIRVHNATQAKQAAIIADKTLGRIV